MPMLQTNSSLKKIVQLIFHANIPISTCPCSLFFFLQLPFFGARSVGDQRGRGMPVKVQPPFQPASLGWEHRKIAKYGGDMRRYYLPTIIPYHPYPIRMLSFTSSSIIPILSECSPKPNTPSHPNPTPKIGPDDQ